MNICQGLTRRLKLLMEYGTLGLKNRVNGVQAILADPYVIMGAYEIAQ